MNIFSQHKTLKKNFEDLIPSEIRAHSLAVAKGCREIALLKGVADEPLFFAGLFHDIGKSKALQQSGFHPLDGALWLQSIGEDNLAHLVARHSTSPQEAELLGLSLAPWDKEKYLPEQAILDAVDLTTSLDGEKITFSQRRQDIKNRYSPDSIEVVALETLSDRQKEYIAFRENLL